MEIELLHNITHFIGCTEIAILIQSAVDENRFTRGSRQAMKRNVVLQYDLRWKNCNFSQVHLNMCFGNIKDNHHTDSGNCPDFVDEEANGPDEDQSSCSSMKRPGSWKNSEQDPNDYDNDVNDDDRSYSSQCSDIHCHDWMGKHMQKFLGKVVHFLGKAVVRKRVFL